MYKIISLTICSIYLTGQYLIKLRSDKTKKQFSYHILNSKKVILTMSIYISYNEGVIQDFYKGRQLNIKNTILINFLFKCVY